MPQERHIGRARVRRQLLGRARVGRSVGKAPPPERAVTSMLPAAPEAPPVFVDPSGTRRRRVRLAVYAIGLLLLAVLAAVWLSQLGGPAAPPARTPCPTASSAEACVR